jgi:hypothetical protein
MTHAVAVVCRGRKGGLESFETGMVNPCKYAVKAHKLRTSGTQSGPFSQINKPPLATRAQTQLVRGDSRES